MPQFSKSFSPPALPGDTCAYSIDIAAQLDAGDSLSGASVTLLVRQGSDSTPSARLVGSATVSGTVVTQVIGGTPPNGLQGGTIYRVVYTATTAAGRTLVNAVELPCASLT